MTQQEIRIVVRELKAKEWTAASIAEHLNKNSHYRLDGKPFSKFDIYRIIRPTAAEKKSGADQTKSDESIPKIPRPYNKKPKVVTFIPTETKIENVFMFVGKPEALHAIMERLVSNG